MMTVMSRGMSYDGGDAGRDAGRDDEPRGLFFVFTPEIHIYINKYVKSERI
jgi:hypothetical protein